MKTEENPFSVPWTKKLFPLLLNDVLENVLVCAQFSSKLANIAESLFWFLGQYRFFPIFMPKLCSGGFNIL